MDAEHAYRADRNIRRDQASDCPEPLVFSQSSRTTKSTLSFDDAASLARIAASSSANTCV